MTIKEATRHQYILKRFARLIQNGRLAHAYLFSGPRELGKGQTARQIAKLLNCGGKHDEAPCDECPACLKIEKGSHPDIHVIDHGLYETIKIEEIRQLIVRIQMRPFEASHKVFIIKNAENLTIESSNALLKTLEEPSPNTLLILTTSFPDRILETVKSRCHSVPFFPLTQEELKTKLIKEHSCKKQDAHFLALFTEGSLGKARLMEETKTFTHKNEIIDEIVYSPDSEAYLKQLAADKERTGQALHILLSWFRDVLLLKRGVDKGFLIHLDRFADLKEMSARYTAEQLQDIIEEIIKTIKRQDDNLNMKIALLIIKEKLS